MSRYPLDDVLWANGGAFVTLNPNIQLYPFTIPVPFSSPASRSSLPSRYLHFFPTTLEIAKIANLSKRISSAVSAHGTGYVAVNNGGTPRDSPYHPCAKAWFLARLIKSLELNLLSARLCNHPDTSFRMAVPGREAGHMDGSEATKRRGEKKSNSKDSTKRPRGRPRKVYCLCFNQIGQ
ncbi:hypothetical protein V2G26_012009 [Clonostachys chloroleuca]